jgi:hypothetical protein
MPHKKTRFVRETLRTEAEERQAHYETLTPEKKLAQIKARPGKSARERARIMASLNSEEETEAE